jgi:hypothetical protein
MKFNEKINSLLKEYVSKEMVSLKKYMTMTEDDKIKDLVQRFPTFFKYYLKDEDIDVDKVMDLTNSNADDLDDNDYIHDIMYDLQRSKEGRKHLYNFGKWLLSKINDRFDGLRNYDEDFDNTDIPSWHYLFNISLIKNQWLIHFTNSNPNDIAKNGFTHGTSDIARLGLTTLLDDVEKEDGGYNFAFTLKDMNVYGRNKSFGSNMYQYGRNAVLFRASGYRFWHNTDGQYQVIFYGRTAKNIIPIESMTHSHKDVNWFVKNKNTNDILFQALDLSDVTDWIQTNYTQYKDVL